MSLSAASIGPYQFRGFLGSGSYAEVKLVFDPKTLTYYACKIVRKTRFQRPDQLTRFENEVCIMQQLRHPGIVQLVDLLHDDANYYVVLELCPNGDLFDFILSQRALKEEESKPIFKEIAQALSYLHSRGIAHRDIKLENILLDNAGRPKIADFGFSTLIESDALSSTVCGSPYYASPELLSKQSYDPRKSDIWSCGVLLYAMVVGRLPWTKRHLHDAFEQIRAGDYTPPSFLSESCRDLIQKLMCVDPMARITLEDALSHPWLADVKLSSALQKNCHSALSVQQIEAVFGTSGTTPNDGMQRETAPRRQFRSVAVSNMRGSAISAQPLRKKPQQMERQSRIQSRISNPLE
jgi:serine/threonine protein kinase